MICTKCELSRPVNTSVGWCSADKCSKSTGSRTWLLCKDCSDSSGRCEGCSQMVVRHGSTKPGTVSALGGKKGGNGNSGVAGKAGDPPPGTSRKRPSRKRKGPEVQVPEPEQPAKSVAELLADVVSLKGQAEKAGYAANAELQGQLAGQAAHLAVEAAAKAALEVPELLGLAGFKFREGETAFALEAVTRAQLVLAQLSQAMQNAMMAATLPPATCK